MTGIEIYRLVLDTLTAVGTVGAVCLSLWLVLRAHPRFAIHKVEMGTEITLDENHKEKDRKHFLIIKLENLLDTPMQVFELMVQAVDDPPLKGKAGMYNCGVGIPLSNTFIPAKGIYNVRTQIASDYETGSFSDAKKVICRVSTSFGDKEIKFPKKWRDRLHEAVEKRKKAHACPEQGNQPEPRIPREKV